MQRFDAATRVSTHATLEFSSDGRYLVLPTHRLTLIDTTASGPEVVRVLEHAFSNFTFARGRFELIHKSTETYDLVAFDLGTGAVRVRSSVRYVASLASDPGGRWFYVGMTGPAQGQFTVQRLDPDTLQVADVLLTSPEVVNRLDVSADGRVLVTEGYGQLDVYELPGDLPPRGARCRILSKPVPSSFALSADGSRLAAALETRQGLVVWDTVTGAEVIRSGKHRRNVTAVAYSPTADLLASGDTGGQVFFWDAAGNVIRRYTWGLDKVAGLRFAPDGLRCAAADEVGKVVIWDVDG